MPFPRSRLLPRRWRVWLGVLLLALAWSSPAAALSPLAAWQAAWQRPAVVEGPAHPRAVIQVFFDPDCPFCHALWQDLRPYVAQGLQVRWIPVAFLHADSAGRVAALLQANDRAAALAYNMRHYDAPGRRGGIQPVPVPAVLAARMRANDRLWQALGGATPTILYRQPGSGAVHGARGITERARIHALFAALLRHDPHAGQDLVKDPF